MYWTFAHAYLSSQVLPSYVSVILLLSLLQPKIHLNLLLVNPNREELLLTFLLLLIFSVEGKRDLLVDNWTCEHPLQTFPPPSKEAMNNEVSFASSFVPVTMLACQAKASDPLFQWHDGICWPGVTFHQVRLQYWWRRWGVFFSTRLNSQWLLLSSALHPTIRYDAVPGAGEGADGWMVRASRTKFWGGEGKGGAERGVPHVFHLSWKWSSSLSQSALYWADLKRHGEGVCVCVGGGLRECMNSINVSKSYLSERSRCKCVKQTLLFFYFCLMVSGFDSYTFTQGIKSYYIRSLIPIRSCVNHPAPNEGIKRTRLYSWEYSVILCFPAVLLHLDKSSPSKVYE